VTFDPVAGGEDNQLNTNSEVMNCKFIIFVDIQLYPALNAFSTLLIFNFSYGP